MFFHLPVVFLFVFPFVFFLFFCFLFSHLNYHWAFIALFHFIIGYYWNALAVHQKSGDGASSLLPLDINGIKKEGP